MSTRGPELTAQVLRREPLTAHLVRLVLGGEGLAGLESTGVPDEWVGLVVPGQFQSRYYTVRAWDGGELTLDVVVHEQGLVTEWASGDPVGDTVTLSAPRGSYDPPADARWLLLVGDLTALPAMARIAEQTRIPDVRIHAETPEPLPAYLPEGPATRWTTPPSPGESALAAVVEGVDWPDGEGYFWMAGESAQMRAIRKHLMRERRLPSRAYDVMGYWRGGARRQPRAVDPGPSHRTGRRSGRNDERIWAEEHSAREGGEP